MAIIFKQQVLMQIASSFLVELISYNHGKYGKKSCFCNWNGKNCIDMRECGEFCQNTDPPLPNTTLEEDLQFKEGLC